MAQDVCVVVDAGDRAWLAAIAADRNRPQKHAQRARIVLLSTDPLSVAAIARLVAVSRPAVWRWQTRCAQAGVDGLPHDETRPAGKPSVPTATVAKVLALICSEPRGQAALLDRPPARCEHGWPLHQTTAV
jgi:Homeodomain-like domain